MHFRSWGKFATQSVMIRHGMGHDDAWAVRDITGLVIDHLVAGVEQSAQSDVDRFGNTDRDKDLARSVVLDIKKAADIFCDGFAQR